MGTFMPVITAAGIPQRGIFTRPHLIAAAAEKGEKGAKVDSLKRKDIGGETSFTFICTFSLKTDLLRSIAA